MDKLTYGSYSSDITDVVFDSTKGYSEPNGEQEVRKQLSFPFKEVKDYINSIANTDSDGTTILLRISADNLIQYSLDGETWNDTASGGHIIYDDAENQMPQRTRLMFRNASVTDTGSMTVVEGIQGEEGVGVSSIVQVSSSSESGGQNVWRATLTNGNTYDFVVLNGQQGEQGEMGTGLIILGSYASLEDLQIAHPTGNRGDCYIVGTSDSNPAYVWDVNDNAWESIGKIRGEKGATGATGAQGVSIQSINVQSSTADGGANIITITLSNGATSTFTIYNGTQGSAGTGMPTGGSAGQMLTKRTSVDYDLQWTSPAVVDQSYDSTSTNAQSGTAVAEAVDELKVIVITSSSFSSLPQTITNTAITANHVVINSVLSNPSAQAGDWTVTTSSGSLTISGSINGSTTVTLYLALS